MEMYIINTLPVELFAFIALLRRPMVKVQKEIQERRVHIRREENSVRDTGENGYKRKGVDRRALERIKTL